MVHRGRIDQDLSGLSHPMAHAEDLQDLNHVLFRVQDLETQDLRVPQVQLVEGLWGLQLREVRLFAVRTTNEWEVWQGLAVLKVQKTQPD